MKTPWWVRHPVLTFRRLTWCRFWGCTPDEGDSFRRTSRGRVVMISPSTRPWCSVCKGVIPVDQAR